MPDRIRPQVVRSFAHHLFAALVVLNLVLGGIGIGLFVNAGFEATRLTGPERSSPGALATVTERERYASHLEECARDARLASITSESDPWCPGAPPTAVTADQLEQWINTEKVGWVMSLALAAAWTLAMIALGAGWFASRARPACCS